MGEVEHESHATLLLCQKGNSFKVNLGVIRNRISIQVTIILRILLRHKWIWCDSNPGFASPYYHVKKSTASRVGHVLPKPYDFKHETVTPH